MTTIVDGDRVRWRSTRRNAKGSQHRTGTAIRVYSDYKRGYAFVKPDKGQGRYQYLSLSRLSKIEVQP